MSVPTKLNDTFSIDRDAGWVRRHNGDVAEVLAAWAADRPLRVPLLPGEWTGQHGFYADEIALDYVDYYGSPDTMLRVQLEAARRKRELPIFDMMLGEPPARWQAGVDFWPVVGPGWVGCRILQRSDSVPAYEGLHLSREQSEALAMPDAASAGILATVRRFWDHLRERYRALSWLGAPLAPIAAGVGTNGFFSLSLDICGEELMAAMCDDPPFASRFLTKVAAWCLELQQTWERLSTGGASTLPFPISDHGIDMLSPTMYERFIVPVIIEMNRRQGTLPPRVLHHCGKGAHLFPVIAKHFGLERIENLTWPFVDVARVRHDLGEDVWITANVSDTIIRLGPEEKIRDAVREAMKAKGRGRFALAIGDMLRGTPMPHYHAFYEAVKEFGGY